MDRWKAAEGQPSRLWIVGPLSASLSSTREQGFWSTGYHGRKQWSRGVRDLDEKSRPGKPGVEQKEGVDRRSAVGDAGLEAQKLPRRPNRGTCSRSAQRTAGATFNFVRSESSLKRPRGGRVRAGLKSGCLNDNAGGVRGRDSQMGCMEDRRRRRRMAEARSTTGQAG